MGGPNHSQSHLGNRKTVTVARFFAPLTAPEGKSLMAQMKAALTSPSLQDWPHAADDPGHAAFPGSLARTRGAPTGRSASRRCCPSSTHAAPAPDCPGNRHRAAASCVARAAGAHAGTLPSRNTLDQEPAGAAKMHRRTQHIAVPPSPASPPSQPGRVRYPPAVNGLLTNSTEPGNHRWQSNQLGSPFA